MIIIFLLFLKKSNTKRSVLHFCVSVSQHNLYDGQIFRRKDILYVQCPLPEPWMRNLNLSWWCRQAGGVLVCTQSFRGPEHPPRISRKFQTFVFHYPSRKDTATPANCSGPTQILLLWHLPMPVPLYRLFMSTSATWELFLTNTGILAGTKLSYHFFLLISSRCLKWLTYQHLNWKRVGLD